ncbi:CACTA en-spm transposon protein [Cucumis melo var. makuwa]|uniref:CACTA en-spm transposon protein n=1 Tax=Cucumis melo var. makuwa TaxID=1194695 RepID=A0A5D3DX89_CUCMM|nr:CACTA en-spm transposon protein [Cucumis melo var. makuwa]TYK27860.1 CACTA en-spm transposon protein [Cucumis melo var. makuwa]
MRPSFDVRCYNGCIVGGLRFHTSELDSRCTTQNKGVMVIGESDASGKEPVIFTTQAHQVFNVHDPKNGSNWKVVQVVQNKRIWDVSEVEDVENDHINVLEIVISHRVDDHIEDDTLCRTDVDPTIAERPVVHHVTDDLLIEWLSSQPLATPTPRRRAQSRLLKLECHVAVNGRILMTIRFSRTIGVCVRKTISVHCLKWADVGREYLEVVKGDLQHQMLITFKEFEATITDTLKSTATPRRLVPTHQMYWLDVMRIDTSSTTTT